MSELQIELTSSYGRVKFIRPNKTKVVYDPSIWDALRAKKKNERQKRLLKKTLRRG